jgi:hypothetical protein
MPSTVMQPVTARLHIDDIARLHALARKHGISTRQLIRHAVLGPAANADDGQRCS